MKKTKTRLKKEEPTNFKEFWINKLGLYNITKENYEEAENRLLKKFRSKFQKRDIVWVLFNRAVIKQSKNPLLCSSIYRIMGDFVIEEGKKPDQYYDLASKVKLEQFKKEGFKEIQICSSLGERTCKECSKLNGKTLKIDEALKIRPIPNKKCKSSEGCRCAVLPVKEN